ncbi:MAG: magnesium transporter [Candidatus Marinimicrobia bacterium]|nr:magnesium transporter [Candidatus Neomarinimicrobiota bacterium]
MKKEMYGHEITVLRDTFRRLLRRHARTNLVKLVQKTHPADLAVLFRYFTEEEQLAIFQLFCETEQVDDFINEVDDSIVTFLLENETPEKIVRIFEFLGSNDQAFVLGLLPDELSSKVLGLLQAEEQEEVEELMAYPDDSAGSMMYTDIFTLHEDTVARDAINAIQDQVDAEMVFYLYVVDDDKRLVGVISLRDLVTTPPETPLEDFMIKNVHSVRAETDQEEVARVVSRYNYVAVPVVDREDRLLGIVTVDDVVDVIREEATEDFLQMAGVGKDREILLKSPWENAKMRLPWLFASWIGGIVAATIIGVFDHALQSIIALAAFIPVIIGMGGNIGTQSSTIIVRGLATGRVDFGNEFKIVFKEVQVGLILGVLYGFLLGIFAYFRFMDAPVLLGLVVGLSIAASMLIATTIGTFVPLFLKKMDIDPAIATGPFVTTSIDILGVTFYFMIATALLPMA